MKIDFVVSILLLFACLTRAAFIGNFDLKSTDLRLTSEVKVRLMNASFKYLLVIYLL